MGFARPVGVVVLHVGVEEAREIRGADDQEMVEALATDGADPTPCERDRSRHWRADALGTEGAPHVVEGPVNLVMRSRIR